MLLSVKNNQTLNITGVYNFSARISFLVGIAGWQVYIYPGSGVSRSAGPSGEFRPMSLGPDECGGPSSG